MEHLFLLPLSILGFAISWWIWYKKGRKQKLVCVIGEDCDKVIRSKYAVTFGIENTILGMLYYVFVFVVSLGHIYAPAFVVLSSVFLIKIIISGAAALFSVYLVYIQLAVLKEWCEYCLASAAVTLAIFLVVLV